MDINLTLLMQMLAFAAFVWFCTRFIWPPLAQAVDKRQKDIAAGLAAGEEGRENLVKAEKRVGELLADARSQAAGIVEQGEKLKADTIEQAKVAAKAEAERVMAAAKSELEQEAARVRQALRHDVAALAVAGAAKILRREVDPKTHAELLSSLEQQL